MEKLLRWNFTIYHISGKRNGIPDALSRFPWAGLATIGPSSQEVKEAEMLEEAVLVKIFSSMVSWPGLQVASKADKEIQEVCRLLQEGADLRGKWARVPKWYGNREHPHLQGQGGDHKGT